MARLSSGKRINSASDDAAGVAISSRLTSNIRGTDQAIRNALDGQALIDTAEGAHKEIENILQRMREIAVQAANDTNNQQDRDNLQAEIEALTSEVDRIAKSTSWAGKDMLDGSFEDKVLQVGASTSSADQVKISIKATGKDELFPPTTTSVRTEATVVTATADSPEMTTTVTQKRVTTGFFSESGEVATSAHPGENNTDDIVLRYNHPDYAGSPHSISFLTDTTDGADSIIEIQGFEYTVTAGTAAEKTANLVEQLQADNVSITTTADPIDATLTLIGVPADVLSDYAEAFGTDSFEVFANPLSADGEGTDGINLTATTEAPSLLDDYVKPPSGSAITTTVTTIEETGPKLGTPTLVGPEFQVIGERITTLNDGGFLITEYSASGQSISGKRYDGEGVAVGTEFQINSTPVTGGMGTAISTLANGDILATWTSRWEQGGSGSAIFGQRFDSTGGLLGDEFQINTYNDDWQSGSVIADLNDGGFIVTWYSRPGQDGSGAGIFGQRYDNGGNATGAEFQINTTTSGDQYYPEVTGLSDGGYVVTWTSPDSSSIGIFGQRYRSDGTVIGGEFQINSYTGGIQAYPSVTDLQAGGFLVTWSSEEQDSDAFGIFAQRFDENGAFEGTEFQVNTTVQFNQINSSVTKLNDGGFLITWSSEEQGGSYDVYGQRYDGGGNAVGSEFLINTNTQGFQYLQASTTLVNGDSVVVWSSSNNEAFAQILEFPSDLTGGGDSTTSITNTSDVVFMDVSSRNNALIAIGKSDTSLAIVNTERASLGAISNRLNHTVNNLTNISANLSAAQGSIEDADFAKETTDLAKNQILQQASTAMLAQANASKQNVLSLLQG